MVEGTTYSGVFVSSQALIITAMITGLSLIAGLICLGLGLGETCSDPFSYDNHCDCRNFRSNAIIGGSIVTATSVISLVVLGAMSRRMKEVAVQPAPMVQQPQTMYYVGSTTGIYPSQVGTQPYMVAPYPLGHSGNLQQNTLTTQPTEEPRGTQWLDAMHSCPPPSK